VIIAWTAVLSAIMFGVLRLAGKIRMPEDVELIGLAAADLNRFGLGYRLKEEYAAGGTTEMAGSEDTTSRKPEGAGTEVTPYKP
jgi:hypothetical protein